MPGTSSCASWSASHRARSGATSGATSPSRWSVASASGRSPWVNPSRAVVPALPVRSPSAVPVGTPRSSSTRSATGGRGSASRWKTAATAPPCAVPGNPWRSAGNVTTPRAASATASRSASSIVMASARRSGIRAVARVSAVRADDLALDLAHDRPADPATVHDRALGHIESGYSKRDAPPATTFWRARAPPAPPGGPPRKRMCPRHAGRRARGRGRGPGPPDHHRALHRAGRLPVRSRGARHGPPLLGRGRRRGGDRARALPALRPGAS